jgi:hypothetical protein
MMRHRASHVSRFTFHSLFSKGRCRIKQQRDFPPPKPDGPRNESRPRGVGRSYAGSGHGPKAMNRARTFWYRTDFPGNLLPGLGPPRSAQRERGCEATLTQTVGRGSIRRDRQPTGWLSGFPTGRPWDFASNRSHPGEGVSAVRGSCLPFPDPFLGSRATRAQLPVRSLPTGSDVPLIGGLSPRGSARHWRRH